MEKQFFIPKKYFYILRVISSLCAAGARFFGRLRGLSQALSGWLLLPQDPHPRHSRAGSDCVQPGWRWGALLGRYKLRFRNHDV